MDALFNQLAPLAQYNQFLIWLKQPRPDGKMDKIPLDPKSGVPVDPHDSRYWVTAQEAVDIAATYGDSVGVAFVITENDPFFFFDVDGCIDVQGNWNSISTELMSTLPNALVEVSQSGTGVHIFGMTQEPVEGDRYKKYPNKLNLGPDHRKFDLYTESRFVALTGNIFSGDLTSYYYDDPIKQIIDSYLQKNGGVTSSDWTTTHSDDSLPIMDDEDLIIKMLGSTASAASTFGNKATVRDLWNKNKDALAVSYPSDNGKEFDHSAADAALMAHLAFWTGKNCERMDALFRRSQLYRDKWENRSGYRFETITGANAVATRTFGTPLASQPVIQDTENLLTKQFGIDPEIRTGYQFLAAQQQIELFKGCVYIRASHEIFMPNGMYCKPEQFKAYFPGYVYAIDSSNEKTTKNAWEVFTQSQAVNFPKVDKVAFRPELQINEIFEEEGFKLLNTYIPINVEKRHGDISPILNHLEKMLPVKEDRDILLAYMAAMVQNPGVKFQWAPLLQGVEGNGKTLYSRILTHAIGRRYTHPLDPQDIGNKFNGWVENKLLVIVEEVYTDNKREVIDALKPLITNDYLPVQSKGVDQRGGDNRANFIMTSNHMDAIQKTKNDRRYCVFYTAQQDNQDLLDLGWVDVNNGSEYFSKMYTWLKHEGYAFFTQYLVDYDIPAHLNPAGTCVRAPFTSSTEEAVSFTLGSVEQEILEAVKSGVHGFQGGWISSIQLTQLLESKNLDKRVPIAKRPEMLNGLGYVRHPGLEKGRVNNTIPSENGKPVLYIKEGGLNANFQGTEAAKAYVDAQQGFTPIDGMNPGHVFGSKF